KHRVLDWLTYGNVDQGNLADNLRGIRRRACPGRVIGHELSLDLGGRNHGVRVDGGGGDDDRLLGESRSRATAIRSRKKEGDRHCGDESEHQASGQYQSAPTALGDKVVSHLSPRKSGRQPAA